MTDAVERLLEALDVPPAARSDRWVPKSKLVEGGGLSSADRRAVEEGVERLRWRATLRPAQVGVLALADDTRDYVEIVVLTAFLRPGAKPSRLTELVHRAVTAPVVLIAGDDNGAALSVGLKRRHEREAGAAVVERLVVAPPFVSIADDVQEAFLDSLDLSRLPADNLFALHCGLAERAEAFAAGRATGRWRLPTDSAQAQARREALTRLEAQRREIARLRKAAASEKRLAARIGLSHEVGRAEADLACTLALLI